MQDRTELVAQLCALFFERFHIDVPSPDADLLESGVLDSLQLVDLLAHLEQKLDFRIDIESLELDDLRTLTRLAGVVAAHAGPRSPAAAQRVAPAAARAAAAPGGGPASAGPGAQGRERKHLTLVGSEREGVSAKPPLPARGSA